MVTQRPVAQYPFAQQELWQRCLELQPSLARDASALRRFGITPERISAFEEKTRLFGEMNPDTVVVQEGAVVTDEKNADQEALITNIQKVMACVALKHDPRTPGYKRFGAEEVDNLREAELHLAGVMVVKQGRKYLDQYVDKGLTDEMLVAVETKNAEFVEGLTERKESENDRHTATDVRIRYANELYAELVAICAAGNTLWRFDDASKAQEYIVDEAPAAAEPAPVPPHTA
jgi:hypothetical protein